MTFEQGPNVWDWDAEDGDQYGEDYGEEYGGGDQQDNGEEEDEDEEEEDEQGDEEDMQENVDQQGEFTKIPYSEAALFEAVRPFPYLYNHKLPRYHSINKRPLWRKVASRFIEPHVDGKFCSDNFRRLRKNRRAVRRADKKRRRSGSKAQGPLLNQAADPLSFLDCLEEQARPYRESNLNVGPLLEGVQIRRAMPEHPVPHSLIVEPAPAGQDCCEQIAAANARREEEQGLRPPPSSPRRLSIPGILVLTPEGLKKQQHRQKRRRGPDLPASADRANVTVRTSSRTRRPPANYSPSDAGSDSSIASASKLQRKGKKTRGRGGGRGGGGRGGGRGAADGLDDRSFRWRLQS
ncbi:uncharacterized protein LOC127750060 [Frankliniella occidentalis]|uniref:Uncharacterized protein LOC127750060 n=1 Tax=Frankliniella occidentalis TaxID=133901 RepID=A0A9C6UCL7_FRAOC|nr:uncharacterized protein LOC127750060 [Frankliniella occidentalis]